MLRMSEDVRETPEQEGEAQVVESKSTSDSWLFEIDCQSVDQLLGRFSMIFHRQVDSFLEGTYCSTNPFPADDDSICENYDIAYLCIYCFPLSLSLYIYIHTMVIFTSLPLSLSLYMYMYMYIYIFICIYIYINIHTCIYVYVYIYIYMYTPVGLIIRVCRAAWFLVPSLLVSVALLG